MVEGGFDWCHFNPRPREGGDFANTSKFCMFHVFQSTPPRRGRLQRFGQCNCRYHFNPRPREGGDIQNYMRSGFFYISIHAPAKGATARYVPVFADPVISIHAPAKGATMIWRHFDRDMYGFQSTPPRRGRLNSPAGRNSVNGFQSTPPRRGRLVFFFMMIILSYFNPRPREGGDAFASVNGIFVTVFQSTPPRRGRHQPAAGTAYDGNFNPRPREGGDRAGRYFRHHV